MKDALTILARITVAALLAHATACAFGQTTATSTTGPATTQAATRPSAEVTPAAAPVLARLSAAYAVALPLKVDAKFVGKFDVAGRSHTYEMTVTSQTPDGIRFIHKAAGIGLAVSNGKRGFLFDERRKAYATLEVQENLATPDELDEAISDILLEENAALLLSLTTDAGELLKRLATHIDAGETVTIDGKLHATLVLTRKDDATITLSLAPDTGLIRRAFIDYRPLLKERGASDAKAGEVTADFAVTRAVNPDPKPYDWQPPEDADETPLGRELERPVRAGGRDPTTGPTTQPDKD